MACLLLFSKGAIWHLSYFLGPKTHHLKKLILNVAKLVKHLANLFDYLYIDALVKIKRMQRIFTFFEVSIWNCEVNRKTQIDFRATLNVLLKRVSIKPLTLFQYYGLFWLFFADHILGHNQVLTVQLFVFGWSHQADFDRQIFRLAVLHAVDVGQNKLVP